MANIGTVKWFNPTKGYGFIAPDQGGTDLFVHISEIQRTNLGTLHEGQKIKYNVATGRNGKSSAVDLEPAD